MLYIKKNLNFGWFFKLHHSDLDQLFSNFLVPRPLDELEIYWWPPSASFDVGWIYWYIEIKTEEIRNISLVIHLNTSIVKLLFILC